MAQTTNGTADTGSATVITVSAGEEIQLPITQEELAAATLEVVGDDLKITLADGRTFLLVGFVDAFDGVPPTFVTEGGAAVGAEELLAQLGQSLEDIQAAAGGAQAGTAAPNQQASFTPGPQQGLIGTLNDEGPVDPTALGYGVPEPLDDQLDLVEDDGSLPPLEWSIIPDGSVQEGEPVTYTVFYTGGTIQGGETILVTVNANNGGEPNGATENEDFTGLSTVLTFTSGVTAQTVSVQTTDDTVLENNETYNVTIGVDPSRNNIVDGTADTTIVDQDQQTLQWRVDPDSSVIEGQAATYTVSYTGGTIDDNVTVLVTVNANNGAEPNGATENVDFIDLATILTFTAGTTAQTVSIQTTDDTILENAETYNVTIAVSANQGQVADGTADTTIVDQDQQTLQWRIDPAESVIEGAAATYTVSYTGGTIDDNVTVLVTVNANNGAEPNGATENEDFTDLQTVLTFTAGTTAQTVSVQTTDDTVLENNETYNVTIAVSANQGMVVDGTADTTIVDQDQQTLQWRIDPDSSVFEGGAATYTVSYTGGTIDNDVTVLVTVNANNGAEPNGATEGQDFTDLQTVLTFTAGTTAQTVSVQTTDDTVLENAETYNVTIAVSANQGQIADGTADTTIVDGDSNTLQWRIDPDSSVTEGAAATYTVSYTGGSIDDNVTVLVTVNANNGAEPNGATEGEDFTDLQTVLTFTAGTTAQTVSVQTTDDTVLENAETYNVTIDVSPAHGFISDGTADTTIVDQDQQTLQWRIDPAESVQEGAAATYTVSYTGGTIDDNVTVLVTVNSNSGAEPNGATENQDFTDLQTVLTFTAGTTAQTVSVQTTNDTVLENAETYNVTIAVSANQGQVVDGTADTTIVDQDQQTLQWRIDPDSSVFEGQAASYTVSYTGGTIDDGVTVLVTVNANSGLEPDGATEGQDFTDLSTVLTFTAGVTAQTVSVQTADDTVVENAETYNVTINVSAGQGTVQDGTADTTIVDQDQQTLQWRIDPDSSVIEGQAASYTVSYTGGTIDDGVTVLVTVNANNGAEPNGATENEDFTDLQTVLTFTSSVTAQTVSVQTTDDTVLENAETYNVTIAVSANQGQVADGTADTTIVDQDQQTLQWRIDPDSSVFEGGAATYTVSYTGGTIDNDVTVLVTVNANNGAEPNGATEGQDFTDLQTVLSFTAGTTAQTVSVQTTDDTVLENAETYNVTIVVSANQGQIADGTADTTIVDGDSNTLQWRIDPDSEVTEGQAATYTVSYQNGTIDDNVTVLVTVNANSGTNPNGATESQDFTDLQTVLTFTAGTTAQTVSVQTTDDTVLESSETYNVTIGVNPAQGVVVDGTADTTIVDNDQNALQWRIDPAESVQEGATATYTVSYTGGSIEVGQSVLVTVNANNGAEPNGATEGQDFTDLSTVLTFMAGTTAQTVSVQTTDDTVLENAETYNVTIAVSANQGQVADGTADTTIVDQDQQTLQWRIDPAESVIEGAAATYTVSYTGGTIDDNVMVLVTVNANSGSEPNGATEGVDFTDITSVLTFTAGTTAQTVSVQTTDDTVLENAETYNVTIAVSANQGQIADGTADTTIVDQDQQTLQWRIDPAESVIEGATATYTVSYTGGTIDDNVTVLVTVNANNGSEPSGATEGQDFTDLATILTFTAGSTAQTVSVQTTDDTVLENAETYNVTINVSANQGQIVDGTADTTIVDQDQQTLQWRIDPAESVIEGAAATYTVSYTGGTIDDNVTVLVTVNANNGAEPNGATENVDFADLQTVLTFTAGTTAQTVSVQTTDDTVLENAETYNVTIAVSANQGQIADGTADTTIVDQDQQTLQWRIDPAESVIEGAAATYTVSYTGGTIDDNVTVLVTVNANSGTNPNGATEGQDFTDLATILTFTAGTTAQTVSVQTTDDTVLESSETYNVTINVSANQGQVADGTADTTIVDNDANALKWRIDPAESVLEGAAATYTVSYTGGTIEAGQSVLVTVNANNGGEPNGATENVDFTDLSTILTFTAGATAQTVSVQTTDDTVLENNETYNVTIAVSANQGQILDGTADTTIVDQDQQTLQWRIDPAESVIEGAAATYTVSYTGGTIDDNVTVLVTVNANNGGEPNGATEGQDFTDLATILTFTAGTTAQTVSVQTTDDTVLENAETYNVTIAVSTGQGQIADGTADTTIVDQDQQTLQWRIDPAESVIEGAAATYTVSYTGGTIDDNVTVLVTVNANNGGEPNGATEGQDFTDLATILTFTAGTTAQTVSVQTTDDTVLENAETYNVTIAVSANQGQVADGTADTTIADQDQQTLQWRIDPAESVIEGAAATYTVSYTGGTIDDNVTVLVTVNANNGGEPNGATENVDFTDLATILIFTAGTTAQTVSVQTTDDTVLENNETYNVTIAVSANQGQVADGTADTTIVDQDQQTLQWRIDPAESVIEGAAATYTVSYTGGTIDDNVTVLVTVNANNGSEPNGATENVDFTDLQTVLTFTAGTTAQTVSVQTTNDTVLENAETYNVSIALAAAVGLILDGTADTTIVDQDHQTLQWSIDPDSSVAEGAAATYTVSYTGGTIDDNVTVLVTVAANSGVNPNGATEGQDFTDLATVLTFTNAATAQTVTVLTTEDTVLESAETYNVTINVSANQGQVADGTADTTIVDNDANALQWRIDPDSSVAEGAAATYTVSYTGGSIEAGQTVLVTVNANSGAGANGASEGQDFTDLATVLTFTAGTTAQTVSVQTTDDTVLENAETYNVTINVSTGQGQIADGTADTTIVDNDANTLQWRISPDSSVAEGAVATYTVSYTGGTIDDDVTVLVTVNANSGADPNGAFEGQDFTDLSTILTFTAGTTAQTVSVQTTDDTVLENAETYNVTIAVSANQGQIADGTADTTIIDNDANTLKWRIDPDSSVAEGAAATYTVSYTGGTIDNDVTVLVTVNANSGTDPNGASEGQDFTDISTVLTFTAGTTAQTVSVQTTDDTVLENAETYNVSINLSTAPANILDGTANTTIIDNDANTLKWRIDPDSSVAEGAAATYTVSYTGGTIDDDVTVLVTVNANSGTDPNGAAEGQDFTDISTVLTFTAGTTAQTVSVQTTDDTVLENAETYNVSINLSTAPANILDGTANTTIIDNDANTLKWRIDPDSSVAEGAAATYTVSYTGGTIDDDVTVLVTVNANSGTDPNGAAEGQDFTDISTVLTFTAGTTAQTVSVQTTDDTVLENAETYNVSINLSTAPANILDGTANTTIIDNDANTLKWRIDPDSSVTEGAAATYTVSYTGGTIDNNVTVLVTVNANSGAEPNGATENLDFTDITSVLTFTTGTTAQTVSVQTTDDTVLENAETYNVSINLNTAPANILDGTANTTIVDQDQTTLQWRINPDGTVTEGNIASYTVSYTGGTIDDGVTVLVTVNANNGAEPNGATEGLDFTDISTVLTFTSGVTSRTVNVQTTNDTVLENAETYNVSINVSANQGAIVDGTANTTIIDQDQTTLQWKIDPDGTVTEGGIASYTVSYTGGTIDDNVTVLVTVNANSGAEPNGATEGLDFTDVTTVLTFTSGVTSRTMNVQTTDDTVLENNETYNVSINVSANQGAIVDGTANTTIIDQDQTTLQWKIDPDGTVTEGGIASYTVSYTGGTIDDGVTVLVTVNANSGAGPNGAIQGTDFTDISTVLTFTNGVTARTVNVQTTDDTAVESAETYNVTIGLGTNHGTITDGTANTTIIDNDDTSPIGGAATATVYERGIEANGSFADGTLPGSNDENAGGSLGYSYQANPPHPTTPFVWSTSVTTTDGESPFGGVALTSGGSPIVWSVSGGGLVLTGTVNGGPHNGEVVAVLTVTNSTTGTYTFEQRGAIDHPDQGVNGTQVDGNDPLRLNFSYTLTDADNDTGNGTLQVTVNDNGPLATAQNASLTDPAAVDTNLMIVLDVSGSMEFDSGLTNLDRLEASLGAINELFEQYESLGDVKVQIVTFASGASTQNENGDGGLWLSIADAKEFLEGVVASGNTNFDAALLTAMTAYANAGKILESDPSPRPVQSVAYFVSDGDPTSSSTWPTIGSNLGDGIQPAEENVWEQFLRDNDINAFAIGIGTGITVSNLNPVAYDGVLEQERNGTQVSDLNDLQQTLVSTIQNQTTGSLGTMGADGGRVSQFTYGDSTFTYNGTTITRTSGTVSFTGVGNLLTIDAAAGSMAVNMATAVYTYTTDAGLTFPVAPEAFGYTLRDNDGDTASGNFQITVTHADSAPIVRDDNLMVISSHGSGFVVDDQWLLWNDTDKDGDTITKIGGDVTINTDSEGSFSYTGQSNSLTDTGIVFVDETNGSSGGDTISGDGLDNIIVGDDDGERISGFEGNDVLVGMGGNDTMLGGTGLDWLIGGNGDDSLSGDNGNDRLQGDAGNDTLAGGAGADELTGGGGADRFVISAGDSSLSLMDVITDFTPGSDQIDLASYGFSGNRDDGIIENVVSSYTSSNTTNFFGSGSGARGVVVEYSNSDDTARVYIDANTNGNFDAGSDVVIQLNNITDNALSTGDFSNY